MKNFVTVQMVIFLFFERFPCRTNNPSLLSDKGGLLSNKAGLLADEILWFVNDWGDLP